MEEKRNNMLHAVAVLIVTPQGIPLVKDPKKPPPPLWKLPGGRGPASETAKEVAIREIKEELGIALTEEDLNIVHIEDRKTHLHTFLRVDLSSLPKLKEA